MGQSPWIKKIDRSAVRHAMVHWKATLEPLVKKMAVVLSQIKPLFLSASSEEEDFKRYALDYSLVPQHLGCKFSYQGRSYTVCGLDREDRECPIVVKDEDGKRCQFPVRIIHDAWEREIPF